MSGVGREGGSEAEEEEMRKYERRGHERGRLPEEARRG